MYFVVTVRGSFANPALVVAGACVDCPALPSLLLLQPATVRATTETPATTRATTARDANNIGAAPDLVSYSAQSRACTRAAAPVCAGSSDWPVGTYLRAQHAMTSAT